MVATNLVEITRFNDRHDSVVEVAGNAAEFAAAIERTLAADQAPLAPRRIEIARSNSWQARIEQMLGLLADEAARVETQGRWEARLKRAYRLARRRSFATIVLAAIAYLLVFQTSLVWRAAEPLKVSAEPTRADAIVVFAGGAGESGQAGGGYQERFKQAVDLYRGGYAPRMIFSTGFVFAFQEGEVMKSLAMANGVPPEAIILELQARNTYENVARTQEILSTYGWKRVLLVSSPYHMRRATMTWKAVAPETEAIPTPVPASQFYMHRRGPSLAQIRGILQEYAAIALYWWRGWV